MPAQIHIIECKSSEGMDRAKQVVEKKGGKITYTSIMPGKHEFHAEFPEDQISTLESNDDVKSVEISGDVSIN
ncbi:hypothetical protein BJ878DRAFT_565228 [Calycina marina]|uniref:Inhibitor I9 domain-containing protein n=1 Tax=Calycina marina TaxID=1763456 RepID=A0A9P7Z8Z1_9HELO|nr:hypothetical protein BJ878DRAFT_565228 [Calycina marina]